jgi:hypothetical protein
MNNTSTEEILIKTFIKKDRQERLLELIRSTNIKKRNKFLQMLSHFNEFDERYIKTISGQLSNHLDIYNKLKSLGAKDHCYVISEINNLDKKELFLVDALKSVVGSSMGSIISCFPEKLAYYEAELADECCILQK